MAFPFLDEEGFEAGTRGHFDAETDTESRLDFPHYSTLAAIPGLPAPYRGAYCMRVKLENDGTPADAYVQETGTWDTGAAGTIFFRFMLWFGGSPTMANNDEFAVFQLWSGASTVEAGVYINYTTANGYRIGIGETSASSFKGLSLGEWHCIEVKALIDSGVGDDGTLDAWIDGQAFTQVTTLDQGAITSGVLGVIGQDAGTTAGTVLFDEVVSDDAQIYPPTFRFQRSPLLTASGHAFVGPGYVDAAKLYSGAATDCVLALFDTDTGNTNDASKVRLELKNTANSALVTSDTPSPIFFQRGCYVSLSGTNPRAQLDIRTKANSDGTIRAYGLKRKALVGNI